MATLKDVAALAGVGMSTASRAISGAGPVSADAAARVRAAIEQLNFRPSSIGRSLSAQSLGMIGVFVPSFFGSYYSAILKQTDTELRALRRHVVVATGCGDESMREQAIEAVKFLISRDCDGILVLGHDLLDEDLIGLHRMHSKMAFLNRSCPHLPEASFCPNHHHGGVLAASALLQHGHRRLAVISGPAGSSDNQTRLDGFFEQLARSGIARDQVLMVESDFSRGGGFASTQALLDQGQPFTGLFCANDEMAIGALSCLHRAGVPVPDQVSVVGYDDDYSAAFSAPGLTSVHMPTAELTQNAVRWLLNQCYGTSHQIHRDFAVTVTARGSLGAPG
ncbi:MAG: substrate-binding domain-containing protein [Pseudomonadota bacterium]